MRQTEITRRLRRAMGNYNVAVIKDGRGIAIATEVADALKDDPRVLEVLRTLEWGDETFDTDYTLKDSVRDMVNGYRQDITPLEE